MSAVAHTSRVPGWISMMANIISSMLVRERSLTYMRMVFMYRILRWDLSNWHRIIHILTSQADLSQEPDTVLPCAIRRITFGILLPCVSASIIILNVVSVYGRRALMQTANYSVIRDMVTGHRLSAVISRTHGRIRSGCS